MKAIIFAAAVTVSLPTIPAMAAQCKAILPIGVFFAMDNYVNVDGTLLLDGQSQCTVVNMNAEES